MSGCFHSNNAFVIFLFMIWITGAVQGRLSFFKIRHTCFVGHLAPQKPDGLMGTMFEGGGGSVSACACVRALRLVLPNEI